MIDAIRQMAVEKGIALMKSPLVSKILASEKMGAVIETAMTVPFKVSSAVTAQKEKLVQLFDLATQEDMDDVRRTITRVEDALKDIKQESADLLKKMGDEKKS